MKYCEFQEYVSQYDNSSHVELVASFNNKSKMMFTKNGKYGRIFRRCDSPKPHHRRHDVCKQKYEAAAFLINCSCPKPEEVCSSGLERTRELKEFCSLVKKYSEFRSYDILRNS